MKKIMLTWFFSFYSNNRLLNRKLLLSAFLITCIVFFSIKAFAATEIKGAGPTFPARLYSAWADEYFKKTGVKIIYRSVGSAEGMRLIKSGEVDFGETNRPLSPEELETSGLFQFPIAIRGIVPVINIKGVEPIIGPDPRRFKLTPEVLADIYLGKITKWNDERIAALNPQLELPQEKIIVVTRPDESGSTWIFTKYLSKVSKAWRDKVGSGLTVNWPVGVGKAKSAGVEEFIKNTPNSIGFVEYRYAFKYKLAYAALENKSRVFVDPMINNFAASGAAADWKNNQGYFQDITDQAGKNAWPITGATYILLKKNPSDCESAKAALDFFDWVFKNEGEVAEIDAYAPLTKPICDVIEKDWTKYIKCGGKALWEKSLKKSS